MAIYKTPRAVDDFVRIVEYSYERFGMDTAFETYRQLEEVEKKLADNLDLGTLDPHHHSERFKYIQISNRQKIFFERIGDDVVIVMAGGDTRNWKSILREMAPYIDKQIAALKERLSRQGS